MDQVPNRLSGWWRELEPGERRHVAALTLISAIYVGHYLVFCIPQSFFIEDAGITFAYARNLVQGDGLVAVPGGERVEGYSNPLWTFLIAGFYALGMPVWTSPKIMGALFGVITLPLVYGIILRARPPRADAGALPRDVALLGPLLLAVNPQFVIWNASGLENSLFCMLLAAGIYRVLVEDEREGTPLPWSALWFTLLSMTRPEGVMYATIAAGAVLVSSLGRRRVVPVLLWLTVFLVPFALYNLWRYNYFAWPFPNTYYAKEAGDKAFQPFGWTVRGWKYIKNYLWTSWALFALPLVVIGLSGLRGWRGKGWGRAAFALGTIAVVALFVAWDGRKGLPAVPPWWREPLARWAEIRVYTIAAAAVLLGVVTLTRPGWRSRGLLWATCSASVFFALYSGGDWMKAFRWFNIVSVTLMPLIAIGAGELVDNIGALQRPLPLPQRLAGRAWTRLWNGRTVVLAVPFLALGGNGAWQSQRFALDPETAVRDVKRRVDYMLWVQKRLDLDHVTLVDVDMGAHMFFPDWGLVDIAGLIDIPIARHRTYDKKFMREYLFEERNPEFAHVHAGWARTSKIPTHPEWAERYYEIPGYPTGATALHVGNHVRRDLFIDSFLEPQPALARFASGVDLVEISVPSPVVAPGGELYLHSAWQGQLRKDGFRILAILEAQIDGGWRRTVSVLPPGYDWYRPEDWKRGEVVHGRQRLAIPEDLPAGTYQLSLALIDEKSGAVLRQLAPGEVDPIPPPVEEEKPKKPKKPKKPGADEPEEEVVEAVLAPEAPVVEVAPPPVPVTPLPEATPYLAGAYRVPVEVRVVSIPEATAAAEEDLHAAMKLASEGSCEAIWPRWKDATRHVMKNTAWQDKNIGMIKTEVSACYVSRAATLSDEGERAAALIEARRYDFRYPPLLEAAGALATVYDERGDERAAAEDWEGAYDAWAMTLKLDPQRSWARRKAEDARDRRLQIGDYAKGAAGRDAAKPDTVLDKPASRAKVPPKPAKSAKPAPAKKADEDLDDALPELGGGP